MPGVHLVLDGANRMVAGEKVAPCQIRHGHGRAVRTLFWAGAGALHIVSGSMDRFTESSHADVGRRVSRVAGDRHTGLRAVFAERWPRLAKAAFFAGVADGYAANLGSGVVRPGCAAITIGTSAALRTVVTDANPSVPDGLWALRCDPTRTLVGGSLTEGGNVHAWALNTLRLPAGDLEAALVALPADDHGLTFVPTLSGQRSPGYDPHARGSLHGLSFDTTPLELLRAAMAGVTYRIADLLERLEGTHGTQQTISLSGNALQQSRVWQQMIADTLGRRVSASAQPEATARGIALLALQGLNLLRLEDVRVEAGLILEPDESRFEGHQRGLERLKRLLND